MCVLTISVHLFTIGKLVVGELPSKLRILNGFVMAGRLMGASNGGMHAGAAAAASRYFAFLDLVVEPTQSEVPAFYAEKQDRVVHTSGDLFKGENFVTAEVIGKRCRHARRHQFPFDLRTFFFIIGLLLEQDGNSSLKMQSQRMIDDVAVGDVIEVQDDFQTLVAEHFLSYKLFWLVLATEGRNIPAAARATRLAGPAELVFNSRECDVAKCETLEKTVLGRSSWNIADVRVRHPLGERVSQGSWYALLEQFEELLIIENASVRADDLTDGVKVHFELRGRKHANGTLGKVEDELIAPFRKEVCGNEATVAVVVVRQVVIRPVRICSQSSNSNQKRLLMDYFALRLTRIRINFFLAGLTVLAAAVGPAGRLSSDRSERRDDSGASNKRRRRGGTVGIVHGEGRGDEQKQTENEQRERSEAALQLPERGVSCPFQKKRRRTYGAVPGVRTPQKAGAAGATVGERKNHREGLKRSA